MTLYTKTQLRPLINKALKMDTLSRWLNRIEQSNILLTMGGLFIGILAIVGTFYLNKRKRK